MTQWPRKHSALPRGQSLIPSTHLRWLLSITPAPGSSGHLIPLTSEYTCTRHSLLEDKDTFIVHHCPAEGRVSFGGKTRCVSTLDLGEVTPDKKLYTEAPHWCLRNTQLDIIMGDGSQDCFQFMLETKMWKARFKPRKVKTEQAEIKDCCLQEL